MMRRCLSSWRAEEGSTSLTLTWFMLVVLMLALGLDSLFGIYIALQQGRTASDAATLAATRKIATLLEETVEEEAASRVQSLLSDERAKKEIKDKTEALDLEQQACALLVPLCTPMTEEERKAAVEAIRERAYRSAFGRLYRGELSNEMAGLIEKGTWQEADSVMKRDHLVPDDTDLGCLVQRTAEERDTEILQDAESLAQANGAGLNWGRSSLAQPFGLHRVVIYRTARPFGANWIFPDGNYPRLHIPNAALLTDIGERTPQYLPSC